MLNLARVNLSLALQERKKNTLNTILIVWVKNGYVETMGVRQCFYYMVSKGGESNHSLCFFKCQQSLIY